MPTFIKPGFWEKKQKGYDHWLNLDQLISSLYPTNVTKTSLLENDGHDGINPFITALDISEIGSSVYDGASPTTVLVGAYPAGTNITGKTNAELFENIYAPFVAPAFSSFLMTSQSTIVESGTIISGSKTFTFGFSQFGNVIANTLQILDGVIVLASNLSVSGSSVTLSIGSITLNGNGTSRSWLAKATNLKNTLFSSSAFTTTSYYKQFFGNVSAFPTNSAEARALSNNSYSYNNSFSIVISSTKFSIAIPATKSLVSVITANNENITSSFVLSTMNVNDAGGTAIAYKIYNFSSAVSLDTNVIINVQ